ncbi:hypothetical protein BJP36_16950 [Moorena producens JHB]|uniref:Uncharacterized protein n=1 Tax=Moorena producens (strain JHB) TaxID=1454205 RepID=A0A1D9G140_MOOP1|nr:hypothetical protein [Moorena producens]AOY81342.1 hypothetical protein BJP36_16950 [Moorena producens JHB]
MADLFTRLARRTLGLMPVVQPRIASRFAPEEAMASENANLEIPSLFEGDRSLRSQEKEKRNREKNAIAPTTNEPTTNEPINTDLELGRRAENQELVGREKIGESSRGIELEGLQRVESDWGDVREKENSLGERVTKEGREVEKRRELKEIPRESPDAIASEQGEDKRSAKPLKPKELGRNKERDFPTEEVLKSARETRDIEQKASSGKGESRGNDLDSGELESPERRKGLSSRKENAIAPGEEVTPRDVVSRNVNPPAVERVRELESKAPNTREVKQLGRNEQNDSPIKEVLTSVRETREVGQNPSSGDGKSGGNQVDSGESKKSVNPDRPSEKIPPRTFTAKLFSRNQEKSTESVRETAPSEPVTEGKVDSRTVKSLELEKGIELESPLKSRGVKEPDSEEFSTQSTSIPQSRKAIASKTRGKVQWENQLTAPGFSNQESETSLPLLEQEKPIALKEIEDGVKLSSRREDQLSQLAPETADARAEKGGETETTKTDRPVQLEDNLIGNNPLQLLESKLAEERKASIASTPTIQVTIGKIEVRGTKPAVKPVKQSRRMQSTVSNPRLSLDEYLKQRNGRNI